VPSPLSLSDASKRLKCQRALHLQYITLAFHDNSYDACSDLNIERQQEACQQLTSVLEEIISIIREVKGDYDSTFMDQIVNDAVPDAQKKLASAVKNVTGMLAKLHAAAEDVEKHKLKEGKPNLFLYR